MHKFKYIVIVVTSILLSCTTDNDNAVSQNLGLYIANNTFETGAVIACAASDADAVLTFFYPEEGAQNIKFFETLNADVDHENYSNYTQQDIIPSPFFNGHLGRFTQPQSNEKWVIITYELEGEVKVSNPIRIKNDSKPTVWLDNVAIDQSTSGMPIFSWEANEVGDNAIYFQVVADANDNLLSGTYTYDNSFQYYNTNNVVLNVTTNVPPSLVINDNYGFTLMDVSLDNWVNLVITKSFIAQ